MGPILLHSIATTPRTKQPKLETQEGQKHTSYRDAGSGGTGRRPAAGHAQCYGAAETLPRERTTLLSLTGADEGDVA